MGKGDKKTKRGKIVIGSSGVRRARKKRKQTVIAKDKSEIQSITDQEELELTSKTYSKKATKKVEAVEAIDDKSKATKSRKKSSTDELPLDEPKQD